MGDGDDDHDEVDDSRFPLGIADRPEIDAVIKLVRSKLGTLSPGYLRCAGTVLLALERLPAVTPGVCITFGFKERDGGELDWADIKFYDNEFQLSVGQHVYDRSVGGDTTSEIIFEA